MNALSASSGYQPHKTKYCSCSLPSSIGGRRARRTGSAKARLCAWGAATAPSRVLAHASYARQMAVRAGELGHASVVFAATKAPRAATRFWEKHAAAARNRASLLLTYHKMIDVGLCQIAVSQYSQPI